MFKSDHQSPANLASLAENVYRVQRWFELLSSSACKLVFRPDNSSSNVEFKSRLPLPASDNDPGPELCLTHPDDNDVYFVGLSCVQSCR